MIKHLPPDARPREKLLAQGPAALADAELVALLLRTGLKGTSVLQLAQQVLDAFGGVAGLLHAEAADLKRIKGLGPAKRAELAAVVELARRSLQQRLADRPAFDSPQAVRLATRIDSVPVFRRLCGWSGDLPPARTSTRRTNWGDGFGPAAALADTVRHASPAGTPLTTLQISGH